MIDVTKPMQIHFTYSNYPVADFFDGGDHVFVRPLGSFWYRFNKSTGLGDYAAHRLVNVAPPPRTFEKKIALIEHHGMMHCVCVTPHMEAFGLAKYLRNSVPGKCVAIKTVCFTEGEGEPPVY